MQERATSFGAIAKDYDRYRPAPPPEVAEWLVPRGAERVADICAGTGTFSRVLAGPVPGVTAVDIDVRMLRVAQDRSPRVRVVGANGESLPFGAGVFDAVVVSSGWHWLDPARALPEMARVLRVGGVLGVVWNGPDRRVEWAAELLQRGRRPDRGGRRHRELSIPPGLPFSRPEHRAIDWSLSRSPSELIGLSGTYSRVITAGVEHQLSVARGAVEVLERHPLLSGRARIDLPMRAHCWRATRLREVG